MNSFRKHAPGNTQRPNSLLKLRAHVAGAAALLLTLLLVAPCASAAPRQNEGAKSREGQTQPAAPLKRESGAKTERLRAVGLLSRCHLWRFQ